MKQFKFLLVLLLVFSLSIIVGCSPAEYSVSFETGTEQTIETQKVIEGEKATKPDDPIKEGYTFTGWYNGEVEYNFDKAVKGNLKLTAKWEAYVFNVSFETGTEQKIDSQNVAYDTKATKPNDPTKEGYRFIGWFNGDNEYNFDEAVKGELKLTAKWEVCVYTVSFETGTEQKIDSQEVEYDKKVTKPEDPTKEGYKFIGWFNGDNEYNFDEAVKGELTLTAKWEEIKTFTVKFIVDGEVIAEVVVEEGKNAIAPKAPTKEGQTFVKWEGSYTNVTANCEVVAVYKTSVYTVEFKVDGVLYGSAVKVEHGKNAEAPADPSKEGYKFIGWDKEFTNITSNLVVNAQFETLSYTIKYYSGSKEISNLEPATYTAADTITLTDYEVTGYYFYGWYNNADYTGSPISVIEEGTSGNLTLYALNVKVDNNGGKDCWTTTIPDGYDMGKGIDEISDLPETFEMDFFKYLSDNDLLKDSRIDATCVAETWEIFSGVNPNHNGDPKRIWNDTSTGYGGAANGYVSVFLYEKIEVNEDLTIKDVTGGFLGTEPYKTKYRGLLDLLSVMHQYKVDNNKYSLLSNSSNESRAFLAFVIDGYFYGTQGIGKSYFSAARSVIPGINFSYKRNKEVVEKMEYEGNALPTPVKEGYVFAGWCLDKEGTKLLGESKATNLCTIYAKWEQIK